ncbi:hypothetical protein OCU04_004171 [Sclerotinia nivalis]|uniref:Uncharacterized protein n=1 Tax=Sclerotinia nivalis TaxID=352851 RepID=A0A9X0DN89_9HELO|nr:hypothetical protein OCU04_004171 [Sclerotinia nivalis]
MGKSVVILTKPAVEAYNLKTIAGALATGKECMIANLAERKLADIVISDAELTIGTLSAVITRAI